MSKERDDHPCLSKEQLEVEHRLFEKVEHHRLRVENKCDICRLNAPTKKLKTSDGLTLNVCEECFSKGIK